MHIERIKKLLESFDIIYSNYDETEYSRKILISLASIVLKCIEELETSIKISSNLSAIKQEIENICDQYEASPMVFKRKSKLIIADKDYNLIALTKELVKNYHDNFLSELKEHLKNGRRS